MTPEEFEKVLGQGEVCGFCGKPLQKVCWQCCESGHKEVQHDLDDIRTKLRTLIKLLYEYVPNFPVSDYHKLMEETT